MTIQNTSPGTLISCVPAGAVPALNAHKSREKSQPRGYFPLASKWGKIISFSGAMQFPCRLVPRAFCRETAVKGKPAAKLLYHVLNLIF